MTTDFVTLFISHPGCDICVGAITSACAHAGVTGSTGCTVNDDRSRAGGTMHVAVVKRAHLVQPGDPVDAAAEAAELTKDLPVPMATVLLFRRSGKYYTEEQWRIPDGCMGPFDMVNSPDFRQIDDGPVLVETQEPWGYPHLLGLP